MEPRLWQYDKVLPSPYYFKYSNYFPIAFMTITNLHIVFCDNYKDASSKHKLVRQDMMIISQYVKTGLITSNR